MIIAIILMVDVTDTTVVSLISDTVDTTVVYRPQVDYRHDGRVRYFSQYGHDGHVSVSYTHLTLPTKRIV